MNNFSIFQKFDKTKNHLSYAKMVKRLEYICWSLDTIGILGPRTLWEAFRHKNIFSMGEKYDQLYSRHILVLPFGHQEAFPRSMHLEVKLA
jgi:hypothetical protein